MSILFHDIIFGPIKSRRLGHSLGINLLASDSKICTFNCIYCECGWNPNTLPTIKFNDKNLVISELEKKLKFIKANNIEIDVLTFAGNGEPTLHPYFYEIVNNVITLRNKYFPNIKIAVLSNATMLHNKKVLDALTLVDLPILKLDSVIEKTFRLINNPPSKFNFQNYISDLLKFKGKIIVQTMFLKGIINNINFDNTTDTEVDKWLEFVKLLEPINVMIYSIDREPPAKKLIKISVSELKLIADKIKKNNINVLTAF